MKTMDVNTSKELEVAEEEEENAMEHKKFRTNYATTETPLICSKEPAAAGAEDQAAILERKKFCAGCKTTKTPLWRVGPSGPKSLCNACGIRYRKKKKKTPGSNSGSQSPEEGEKFSKCLSNSVKMSLVILGKDWLVETSVGKKQRRQRKRKLREEEIAAASLMALSCGSVFA